MTLEHHMASADNFRAALGSFATGVNVITTVDSVGRPCGMTATSFSSVSTDPLLVLVCVNRDARTYEHISTSGHFAVNVLDAGASEISDYCARPGSDKGLAAEWLHTHLAWRSPVLTGALVVLDCETYQDVRAGTHAVLIGRVIGIGLKRDIESVQPLLRFRGTYRQLQLTGSGPSYGTGR